MKPDLSNKHLCPVQKLALLLSDAWTMLIIRDLLLSEKRFCELEKSLEGISTRTLTLKLTKLTEEHIVQKKDNSYSLTKKGLTLREVIHAMEKVGKGL